MPGGHSGHDKHAGHDPELFRRKFWLSLAWAGITLSPAVGAVLMSASTIVVAANAQLLRRVHLTPNR